MADAHLVYLIETPLQLELKGGIPLVVVQVGVTSRAQLGKRLYHHERAFFAATSVLPQYGGKQNAPFREGIHEREHWDEQAPGIVGLLPLPATERYRESGEQLVRSLVGTVVPIALIRDLLQHPFVSRFGGHTLYSRFRGDFSHTELRVLCRPELDFLRQLFRRGPGDLTLQAFQRAYSQVTRTYLSALGTLTAQYSDSTPSRVRKDPTDLGAQQTVTESAELLVSYIRSRVPPLANLTKPVAMAAAERV